MSSAGVAAIIPAALVDDPALYPVRFDGGRSPHCFGLDEAILIFLTVPGGAPAIPMRVLVSDSIASVKLRIQRCKGFVVKNQRLVLRGRELARNDSLVRDYGVTDGNVLHLVLRFSGLCLISVRTVCGKRFEFQVERSRTVRYVKHQIERRSKDYVVDDQKLICEGEELDDNNCINKVCKQDGSVIHLLVRKPAKVRTKPVNKDFEICVTAPEKIDEVPLLPSAPVRNDLVEPVVVNTNVELPLAVLNMVRFVQDGLDRGKMPLLSAEGSGGVYFMQDSTGRKCVAVFKPIDEEPMAENNPRGLPLSVDGEGLKRGTRVGEGALREVAAYILDHPIGGHMPESSNMDKVGFSGVPPTAMVRCLNDGFGSGAGYEFEGKNYKVGSLQMFVKNNGSCEDMGPRAFPVEEVHKIAVLDMRLANADRHAGNILICKKREEGQFVLVPIDHGYCLPDNFEDCTFEWLYWPQAREPFNSETLDYIKSLDAEGDIALLKFHGWDMPGECARTLHISTMLLRKGAERGLTPYDIGSIMCRVNPKKESMIEEILQKANDDVLPGSSEFTFLETVSEIMDGYLEKSFPQK